MEQVVVTYYDIFRVFRKCHFHMTFTSEVQEILFLYNANQSIENNWGREWSCHTIYSRASLIGAFNFFAKHLHIGYHKHSKYMYAINGKITPVASMINMNNELGHMVEMHTT